MLAKSLVFVVFAVVLDLCRAADTQELDIQAMLKDLPAESATFRDDCLKKNSLKLEDLKDYEHADEIPESDLCFYKCFFEGLQLLDKDGNVVIDSVKGIEDVSKLGEDTQKELYDCLEQVGTIKNCEDMKKLTVCFGSEE